MPKVAEWWARVEARADRASPAALLPAAALISAAALLVLGAGLTFVADEWQLLLQREEEGFPGFVLEPLNEHPALLASGSYRVLLELFGIESTAPFRVLGVAVLTATAVVVFVYVRRRVGEWLALLAAVLVLFFGPGWEILLLPVSALTLAAALAAGIGALLTLERGDPAGRLAACGLLTVSLACSSLGVAFVAGAAVCVATGPDRLGRAYVPAVPLALFGLWWVGYGADADTAFSGENALTAPLYMFDGIAVSLTAVLGAYTLGAVLSSSDVGESALLFARPLLVVGVAAAVWRMRVMRPVPRGAWAIAAAATFWLAAGINRIDGREPWSSRYMYVGAVLIVLFSAELLRGVRIGAGGRLAIALVAAVALVSNLAPLVAGKRFLDDESDNTRAELAALEIAQRTVDPAYTLGAEGGPPAQPEESRFVADPVSLAGIEAGSYLSAAAEPGSPAYSLAELGAAPEAARAAADLVLSQALPIELTPAPGRSAQGAGHAPRLVYPAGVDTRDRAGCTAVALKRLGGIADLSLPPGGGMLAVGSGGTVQLAMRRFATTTFPAYLGEVAAGARAQLDVPRDRATQPWILRGCRAPPR